MQSTEGPSQMIMLCLLSALSPAELGSIASCQIANKFMYANDPSSILQPPLKFTEPSKDEEEHILSSKIMNIGKYLL